ncbi:cell division septation protein DedD [Actinoplanes tereljensis]|uniref:pectate lyase n=1 Tax=Paractinoplanes tereljensis TaxID=571912 RepID=UPI00194220B0|nr:pectate lyase [Actinoplanes tereljensis]
MKHAKTGGRRRAVLVGVTAAVVAGAVGITATAFAGSTSLSDNFEDGDTAGWSKSGGSWAVVTDGSKALRQSDAASALARQFAGDTGWTDYTLSAKVRAVTLSGSAATAGIAARAGGAHEFDRLVLVPGAVRLEEVKGSAVTVLGSLTLASAATGFHTLRLDVSGSTVTGYVDGAKVGSGSAKLTKGRVGLITTSAAASFDDVSVTALAGAPATTAPTATATATASPTPTKTTAAPTTASPSPTKTATATATPTAVATSWPKATGTTTLTATKAVSGTFDGGNVEFIGGGALGDGGQDEGQDPLFQLADGATLSNVIIGAPAADGVHCAGSCTLKNVWWLDVGEDAATFKGTSASQTMTIDGGGAMHASDKVFQHNGPGTFVIKNFQASDIGKLYRSCGNCSKQFARKVQISNVTVTAPLKTLAGINPNLGDTATITNATIIGGKATNVCALFKGVTSGEPTETSNVPDGVACIATGITLK